MHLQANDRPGRETVLHWHRSPAIGHNGHVSQQWVHSVTPIAPPRVASPSLRFLVYAGLVTGIWAGVLCLALYGIGHLLGITFTRTTSLTQTTIGWTAALVVPIIVGILSALIASLVRGIPHAGRVVFWAGTILGIASCAVPLHQADNWGSRVVLVMMHAITWALVVPQVARIVGDSEPGASVDR